MCGKLRYSGYEIFNWSQPRTWSQRGYCQLERSLFLKDVYDSEIFQGCKCTAKSGRPFHPQTNAR